MEAAAAEIKPNIKKAFVLNILVIGGIVALVIASSIYIHTIVGLGIFLDAFRELGIIISPTRMLSSFIGFVFFLTGILLILNYVALGKITYTLYPDKLEYSRNLFILELSSKTIPYANVAKVYYESKAFLNSAKVILELTGMKESKVEMDFIDNAQEVVQEIQRLIANYKADYYARYSQDYRYQNIMDRP